METEYAKCIKNDDPEYQHGIVGVIYEVLDWNHSPTDCMIKESEHGSCSRKRFNLCTKEEYESQYHTHIEIIKPQNMSYLINVFKELNIQ